MTLFLILKVLKIKNHLTDKLRPVVGGFSVASASSVTTRAAARKDIIIINLNIAYFQNLWFN